MEDGSEVMLIVIAGRCGNYCIHDGFMETGGSMNLFVWHNDKNV